MVVEFPKLQGVMGRIYASIEKEPDEIAVAIEEHYRPIQSGGILPGTRTGALLAISDKIDSICGCFSVDMIPTGTSDPYALRRQGIGLIQIILNKGFLFSLKDLIVKNMTFFHKESEKSFSHIVDNVYTFLQDRMTHLLMGEGFAKDTISAVIGALPDCVPDVWEKVKALEKRRASADFEPIAVAFKRVVNIIKKSADIQSADIKSGNACEVDEHLFEHASENVLFSSYKDVAKKISKSMHQRNFDNMLDEIAQLRDPVDAFFDHVMVMAEDEALRINRLALLRDISGLFGMFADFSKLSA